MEEENVPKLFLAFFGTTACWQEADRELALPTTMRALIASYCCSAYFPRPVARKDFKDYDDFYPFLLGTEVLLDVPGNDYDDENKAGCYWFDWREGEQLKKLEFPDGFDPFSVLFTHDRLLFFDDKEIQALQDHCWTKCWFPLLEPFWTSATATNEQVVFVGSGRIQLWQCRHDKNHYELVKEWRTVIEFMFMPKFVQGQLFFVSGSSIYRWRVADEEPAVLVQNVRVRNSWPSPHGDMLVFSDHASQLTFLQGSHETKLAVRKPVYYGAFVSSELFVFADSERCVTFYDIWQRQVIGSRTFDESSGAIVALTVRDRGVVVVQYNRKQIVVSLLEP